MLNNLPLLVVKLSPINYNINNQIISGERDSNQINSNSNFCNDNLKIINFPSEFKSCADKMCNDMTHIHN